MVFFGKYSLCTWAEWVFRSLVGLWCWYCFLIDVLPTYSIHTKNESAISSCDCCLSRSPFWSASFCWVSCTHACMYVCVCVCVRACAHVHMLSPSLVSDCNFVDYSPLGSSVHGVFQARILEWVAISFSRGTSSGDIKLQGITNSWVIIFLKLILPVSTF